jgi:hypothetical protein
MQESDLQGGLLTTTPATIPPILGGSSPYSGLNVGEYVDVSADLRKGKCVHGGMACYVTVRSGPGADAMYTVSYRNGVERLKSMLKKNVPISRLVSLWKASKTLSQKSPTSSGFQTTLRLSKACQSTATVPS